MRERQVARYVWMRTLQSLGRGVETAILVIFLVESVGLTPAEVGIGTSAAAAAGLVVGFPAGVIADRLGVKKTFVVLQCFSLVAMIAMVAVFNFTTYLISVCLFTAAFTAANPVSQALAGLITNDRNRATAMALARAGTNLGYAIGSILAFPFLLWGETWIGRFSLGFTALCLALGLVVLMTIRVPEDAVVARPRFKDQLKVLADTRYAALALLMSATNMVYYILNIGVPLWVAFHGNLSNTLVSLSLLLNTTIVIALQFPLGGRVQTVRAARTAAFFVGAGLTVTCVFLGWGLNVHSVAGATLFLMLAVAALSVSEVLQSAAAWELSFSFAAPHARTTYLSIFTLMGSVAEMAGPFIITTFVMQTGAFGWYALGAFLALNGLIVAIFVTQYHKRYKVRTVEVQEF